MDVYKGPKWTECFSLDRRELFDTVAAESDELGQLVFGERGFFARALDFDELAAAGHDQVHIDRGRDIFAIVEVEQGLAFDEADADGGEVGRENLENGDRRTLP